MREKTAVRLGDVQKTLFLPLWGRACETQKADPLLVDRAALEIIEKVDFDFSTIVRNITDLSRVGWIMRSMCVDRVVADVLAEHPSATIVNLGCGLDTTFDRMDNGRLIWYDLDLPDVIELRSRFIKENDRRKTISASFLEDGWLKEITPAPRSCSSLPVCFTISTKRKLRVSSKSWRMRSPDARSCLTYVLPWG